MKILPLIKKVIAPLRPLPQPPSKPDALSVFMVSNSKKNQGWFRDKEILRRTNGVLADEYFPYSKYGFDIRRVMDAIYKGGRPDLIYVHYNRAYTNRLKGFSDSGVPVVAFVGDPQDFLDEREAFVEKRRWLAESGVIGYMTIAPQANWMVRKGIGDESVPIINSHLAVDADLFDYCNNHNRDRDIGSFGAHTDKKYPFRIMVRDFLTRQDEFSFNGKQRVGSGGNDARRFIKEMSRYRSCFTCASAYGYTVAKYFEIPAAGALLFGEKTQFLDDFGYIDGENFVEVSPENFRDKFSYYLRELHQDDFMAIARRGTELVRSRHTWGNRADGIVEGFKEIAAGNFMGK